MGTAVLLQQRQKIVSELQHSLNQPSAWLQLISYDLNLVDGDVKKCVSLGKMFENARSSVSKEFYQHEDYISLCLGNARMLMYVMMMIVCSRY